MARLEHKAVDFSAKITTCAKCEAYEKAIAKYKIEKQELLNRIDKLENKCRELQLGNLDYFTLHLLYGWDKYPLGVGK